MIAKALTIAGSDSGGGAGIQADLKTFQERHVFGMSAITAVTAQNTLGVQGVYPLSIEGIQQQIDSIATDLYPDAVKTGMLFSSEITKAVADKMKHYGFKNIVVDPVMIAKGGSPLLQEEAVEQVKASLLPIASVITPNLPEAEVLTGMKINDLNDRKEAAKVLHSLGVASVVIKGGHGEEQYKIVDLLFNGRDFIEIDHQRLETKHTHGTGCTFAACVTAELAKGRSIEKAVETASEFVHYAIKHTLEIGGGHGPTNHWAFRSYDQKVIRS
ncbi:bifunctional hydroxymethylpyrimidine kinase/phosphomethylpyrimidine kinase [Priestia koreensis]|uniref:Hydroxymethylpyrimidine/phosphomethylpyrimidine kinase n=1 Tax=Priestia koreensis TaxID=284581 RepID=A0A0M0L7W1_9BACI|nr:bifunctional hydroxymethylpyrimidine kinase/phosphomethylpyrimidine kinase [Priestia koreensis]KOO47119.1 phosphomethylpyrimidine kinase [Priestia koreensis]